MRLFGKSNKTSKYLHIYLSFQDDFGNCYLTRMRHLCTNLDFVNISGTTHHLHPGADQLFGDNCSDADRGSGHQSHSAPPAVHRDPNANLSSRSKTSALPKTVQLRSRCTSCHVIVTATPPPQTLTANSDHHKPSVLWCFFNYYYFVL